MSYASLQVFVLPVFSGKAGKSLLHEAAALGLHHLTAQLVSKGLDVDGVDPENGWTPVHYACHNGLVSQWRWQFFFLSVVVFVFWLTYCRLVFFCHTV